MNTCRSEFDANLSLVSVSVPSIPNQWQIMLADRDAKRTARVAITQAKRASMFAGFLSILTF